jgi:hypothetical protein
MDSAPGFYFNVTGTGTGEGISMLRKGWYWEAEKGGAEAAAAASTATTATTAAATETSPEKTEGEKKFSQADVDQIVKERLERERRKAQEEAEKVRRQAEEEAAKKNGEWQTLAEQRQEQLKKVEQALREERTKAVAARLGMTDLDYAVYLVTKAGDGADAETVLKEHVGKTHTTTLSQNGEGEKGMPNTQNPTKPSGSQTVFSRSQLRDPVFFQANREAILQAAREGRIREE